MNKYSVLLRGIESASSLGYFVNIALCAESVKDAEARSMATATRQAMSIVAVEEIELVANDVAEPVPEEVSGRIYFPESQN